jgi:anthranilate synthase/aminodeoxychorismate synthase-like glutamine amidotransferase
MILLIDNYDSFTYLIADYFKQFSAEVLVRRNDEISIDEIKGLSPAAIVISPGPGTPVSAGITMQVIDTFHRQIPMLGVCLGYQAMGEYFGCKLIKSTVPMHGKTSWIHHNREGIFNGIPNPVEVMRYHSLIIRDFPPVLTVTASTETGEPMALAHNAFPLTGVQFHPESIGTNFGLQMIHNWVEMLRP